MKKNERTENYIGEIDVTTIAGKCVLEAIQKQFGNKLRYRGRGARLPYRDWGVSFNYCSDLPVKYAERVALYKR